MGIGAAISSRQCNHLRGLGGDRLRGRGGFYWRVKNPTAARLTYQLHIERIEKWLADVVEA
jgi:hypothetical protein